jgi:hypothetical protein
MRSSQFNDTGLQYTLFPPSNAQGKTGVLYLHLPPVVICSIVDTYQL